MAFVNSAVLIPVITLSIYVSNIYGTFVLLFYLDLFNPSGRITGRCFLLEGKGWYVFSFKIEVLSPSSVR